MFEKTQFLGGCQSFFDCSHTEEQIIPLLMSVRISPLASKSHFVDFSTQTEPNSAQLAYAILRIH